MEPQAAVRGVLQAAPESAAADTTASAAQVPQALVAPTRLNEIWAIDFMLDALYGGRRFRTLNVLDEGNREGLAIKVGTSIPATPVIQALSQLVALYGRPDRLRLDNGPELTSRH